MKITFGEIVSREIPNFSFHSDAIRIFESLFSNKLLGFKSDLVETISIRLICVSSVFCKFFKIYRPRYYEDKTVKIRGSVTPEVRMYKCLLLDFVVDFETYFKLTNKEECLKFLALSFVDLLKTLKYPGALKKIEKEKLLQTVRDILIENSIISVHDSI